MHPDTTSDEKAPDYARKLREKTTTDEFATQEFWTDAHQKMFGPYNPEQRWYCFNIPCPDMASSDERGQLDVSFAEHNLSTGSIETYESDIDPLGVIFHADFNWEKLKRDLGMSDFPMTQEADCSTMVNIAGLIPGSQLTGFDYPAAAMLYEIFNRRLGHIRIAHAGEYCTPVIPGEQPEKCCFIAPSASRGNLFDNCYHADTAAQVAHWLKLEAKNGSQVRLHPAWERFGEAFKTLSQMENALSHPHDHTKSNALAFAENRIHSAIQKCRCLSTDKTSRGTYRLKSALKEAWTCFKHETDQLETECKKTQIAPQKTSCSH